MRNLDTATKAIIQKHFTTMWRGLEAQGWVQSVDGDGACVYADGDGKCCAIGHLIKDSEGVDTIGGLEALLLEHPELVTILLPSEGGDPVVVKNFLFGAQNVHDTAWSPEDMRMRFIDLAADYGVEVPQ